MLLDIGSVCRLTVSFLILVYIPLWRGVRRTGWLSSPIVIGIDDLRYISLCELSMDSIFEKSHLRSIDKECLIVSYISLTSEEPYTSWDTSIIEELFRKSDDTLDKVSLHEIFPYFSFSARIGCEGAIREDRRHDPSRSKMIEHMLYPSEVCISCWGHSVFPSAVILEDIDSPV